MDSDTTKLCSFVSLHSLGKQLTAYSRLPRPEENKLLAFGWSQQVMAEQKETVPTWIRAMGPQEPRVCVYL